MIKSRLTLTLLGACAVLAAAWPFRYQLYLHLPSEPVHRLVVKDGLYWLKGKVYSGRITETDVLKGGGLITITPVIDGVREGRSVTFDDGEPVATAEWVAGKLEGPAVRTSRRTGRVLEEAFYKDGRLDGERRLYGDDGTLLRSETHARGVLDGMVREFAPDGTKRLEAEYRRGSSMEEPAASMKRACSLRRRLMLRACAKVRLSSSSRRRASPPCSETI